MSTSADELALPPFEGFRPQAMVFLEALNEHQNKEWFGANRGEYEQFLRGPLLLLVADVAERPRKAKLPFCGDPHRALFRINRDVRFSKDKRPYKTHVSAALTRDGEKNSPGIR